MKDNGQKNQQKLSPCNYSVRKAKGKRKILVQCTECSDEYSFDFCLGNLILTLQEEYKVDSLIIGGHMERQYSHLSMDILNALREIADDLDRFSSRDTGKERCEKCELKPQRLYPRLKDRFLKNSGEIYGLTARAWDRLDGIKGCDRCKKDTTEELSILTRRLNGLRSKILVKAYGIVGD